MLSTSTVEILKKLSPQELKRFGDFLKSPYFNTTGAHEKIYDIVTKAHPDYTSEDLKSEAMSVKIFGKGEFKEKRLKNLCSELGNLLQKFIGYELIDETGMDLDINIAKGLVRRGLFKNGAKFIEKSETRFKDMPYFHTHLLYYKYNMESGKKQIRASSERAFYKNELDKIENERCDSMVSLFLRDFYEAVHMNDVSKGLGELTGINIIEKFNEAFDIKVLLKFLKESNSKHYPFIKTHYLLSHHFTHDISEELFYELKKDVFEIAQHLGKLNALDIILKTIHVILIKLIPRDRKYYHDIVDLGKLLCELKIFESSEKSVIGRGIVQDIFLPAVIVKEYDWAEKFAREYCMYLREDLRENELNYCMGVLSFKRGKYEESLNYINIIKLVDFPQKHSVYYYYLMNYIEIKAYENALSTLQTFKQFFLDQKNPPEFFKNSSSSLKFFAEIIKSEMNGKKVDGLLYEEAKSINSFPHKPYVLEKMEKLL